MCVLIISIDYISPIIFREVVSDRSDDKPVIDDTSILGDSVHHMPDFGLQPRCFSMCESPDIFFR
jgi:hypothetical protein